MIIVIAPDGFKGSLTTWQVASAIEEGFKSVFEEAKFVTVPISDGGRGTAQILTNSVSGRFITKSVTGPLGQPIDATYGYSDERKTAYIEIAETSGLHLVERHQLNPLITTTYGSGELILDAIELGAEKIIIAVGGTCTNDGGVGLFQALGVRFLDPKGNDARRGGISLTSIQHIDTSNIDPRVKNVEFIIANDVENKLYGPKGAARVFAKQKGASEKMIEELDNGLKNLAFVIKEDLNIDVDNLPGGGSGGGIGSTLYAILNAKIKKGIDFVMEYVEFKDKIQTSDLVITGEGRIDGQTKFGKTVYGISKIAKSYDKKVIAFCGTTYDNIQFELNNLIDAIIPIIPENISVHNIDYLYKNSYNYLKVLATNTARILKLNLSMERKEIYEKS